ncbi:hypothetical protein QQP08_015811 [Theobroma cacao]|nr:hypothetical protein QQP08_015811 [Theobroma cacao]
MSLEKQALEWKGFEASGTILLHPNADLPLKSWSVVEIVIASSGTPVMCTTTDVLSSSSSFSFFFSRSVPALEKQLLLWGTFSQESRRISAIEN